MADAAAGRGRLRKAFALDSSVNPLAIASQQLPEDDFRSLYGADIQEPPFALEQLVFLAEQHPVHGAALEQAALDVVGKGWMWKNADDDENTDQRDQLEEWFTSLIDERRDETIHEILLSTWNDKRTVGHGIIELARAPGAGGKPGPVKYMYPMPAHTTRFGREGVRVVQIRQGKRVWFKRWMPNDPRVVGAHNGVIYPSRAKTPRGIKIGNECLVFKSPARRSTWYGIPSYIPALGWITLSVLARDDNILYFDNRREPRWAIILTNMDDDPNLEDDLRDALRVDLKQPHRNLVIPIEGPGTIEFKQLTDLTKNDMSFDKLQDRSKDFILVAHKMPADRLGLTRVGVLGGNTTLDANRVYKEVVVMTDQAVLAARVNRFIKFEGPVKSPTWEWFPNPLDMTEEQVTSDMALAQFQAGVIKLNECRRAIGLPELPESDPRGEMYVTELAALAAAQQQEATGGAPGVNPDEPTPPETADEETRSGNLSEDNVP